MPEVSPKVVAAVALPVVGVGFGLTFYLMKAKQRVITLTADKTTAGVCIDWVTFTGTVTDGFGRPVANETVTIFADGQSIGDVQTDVNGNFGFRIFWHTNNQHIDRSGSENWAFTACVGKYCSAPVNIVVSYTSCTQCPAPS
jgi:hypothetical protein